MIATPIAVPEHVAPLLGEFREQRIHSIAEAGGFLDELVALIEEQHWPPKDVFAVQLAIEEGLVNAAVHGNRNDPMKWIKFRYLLSTDAIIVEIEDEGSGFDPKQVADPLAPENIGRSSGRGLMLMHAYSTWMMHNQRGNCVRWCRVRHPAPKDRVSAAG